MMGGVRDQEVKNTHPARVRPIAVASAPDASGCGHCDPIECALTPEPTKEQVNEVHARLVDGFVSTFAAHKAEYGWADRELKLV